MAEKFACTYRFVHKDGDKVSRVVLSPGDDVPTSKLPKGELDRLRKEQLVVKAHRLSEDNARLPYGHPDNEAAVASEDDSNDDAEAKAKAEAEAKAAEAKKQTAGSGK